MARIDTLTNFLTDVADSIREKKGTSELIQASNFDTEIDSIESGSDLDEYFETNANSNEAYWVRDNFIKKFPSIIIDDSITNLTSFCANLPYKIIPKIICNNNVTNFMSLYNGCNNATTIDVSGLNSSNVTNMENMFINCQSLESLNLSNFNTSNVTNMSNMFYGCVNLTNLNLSNFNTSNVTNMSYMFSSCSNLTNLNLSNFNTSNVTNMRNMFYNCQSLTNLDIRNFTFEKVTNTIAMFTDIPANCLIIVKDETAKSFVLSVRSDLTNVKTVAEYEV